MEDNNLGAELMEGDDEEDLEDEVFGSFNALGSLLEEQDDRGLVLSLAAFAEEALGKLLKAYLLPVGTSNELVDGFNAPLGNFSTRIKAAYSLGLVTKRQFDDLQQLRKIRNLFAHTWQHISIDDQRVLGHIKSMNYASYLQSHPETAKEKLQTSGYALLLALTGFTGNVIEHDRGVKIIAGEIFFGFPGDFEEQIRTAKDDFQYIANRMQSESGEPHLFYRQALITLYHRTQYITGTDSDANEQTIIELRNQILERAAHTS